MILPSIMNVVILLEWILITVWQEILTKRNLTNAYFSRIDGLNVDEEGKH